MNDLVKKEEVSVVKKEKIVEYLKAFGLTNKLSDNQIDQFINVAVEFQLNPFKKEVYCIPYGQNLSIITGFEVYLKRAERTGLLSGWETEIDESGSELKAKITIWRKDWTNPFRHEVYLSEYQQNNQMWKSKPKTMLRKVVIAQGFRLAFPEDLGGIPYTSDELPDKMTTPKAPVKQVQPKNELDEEIKKLLGHMTENFQNKEVLKSLCDQLHISGFKDIVEMEDNSKLDLLNYLKGVSANG